MTTHGASTEWRLAAARVVAAVAAVYCGVLMVLMAVSAVQMRARPPLDAPELESLRAMARDAPGNASLQEQVRALDLLARRAHFANVHALRVGGGLLAAGVAVLLGALHVAGSRRARWQPPGKPVREDGGLGRRRALLAAGLVVLFLAVAVPWMRRGPGSRDHKAEGPVMDPADTAGDIVTADWPGFRGPGGLGVAGDARPPLRWDGERGSNIVWRTPVPRPGFSSPVVAGDKVFLTGGDASLREIYAFDAATGELLWRHPATGVEGAPAEAPDVTDDTGYAAASPATDGQRVIAIFADGTILAVDPAGRREWARNLGVPDNPYGHASSLVIGDGKVFVQFDDAEAGRLYALDVRTGETVWHVAREVDQPCWASPILAGTSRGRELILNGNPMAAGYDPATGDLRWRHTCMEGEVAVSPAWTPGTVFMANEYARLVALDIGETVTRRWESMDDLPSVSSPVVWSGGLFMATSYGVVVCRNVEDGAVLWREEFDDGFYASPVVADGRLYLMDRKGVMHVLSADDRFEALSRNPLGEVSTCTAAFVGKRLYIRGVSNLYGIGE